MSVWKNRNTWRFRVQRDGHVVTGSGRTRQEAQQLEARAVAELSAGHTGRPVKRSLDEALTYYLGSPEYLALKSAASLADKAGYWADHTAGKSLVQAPQAAQEAVRAWYGAGLKPATINRRVALLRRVLNLAYRQWGWLNEPLADKIQLLPGEDERHVYLQPDEAVRLRRAIRHREARAWVSILVYSGIRAGELEGLRPDQVRDGAIFLDARTKTGRPRAVPVLPPGTRYLKMLPLTLRYQGLRRYFEAARKAIGRPELRLHDLRHTLASWLAGAGANTRDLQVWLGHTNPVTTARYAHLDLTRLQAVAKLVERKREKV